MPAKIAYHEINTPAVSALQNLQQHVRAIDPALKELIELHISQINGCVFCLNMHAQAARTLGVEQQKLDCLAAWQEFPHFTAREKAALAWAEAMTAVSPGPTMNSAREAAREQFSDEEFVDLTLIAAMINTWNRLAIGFGQVPE